MLFIIAWLFFGLMIAAGIRGILQWEWKIIIGLTLPSLLVHGFFSLSVFYLCRVFPLRATPLHQMLLVFLIAGLMVTTLWNGLNYAVYRILSDFVVLPADPKAVTAFLLILFTSGIFLYWLSAAVHFLMMEAERAVNIENQKIEYQLLAKENEIKMLRSQIDPHFLFNSLNSLNALIKTDPEAARRMTYALADFFRKTLSIGQKSFIPLRDEMELIGHFLEIEKIRFGDRLQCAIHVEEPCLNQMIPVFLLQPLVENAVKHGISRLPEGGTLGIRIRRASPALRIEIQNPYDDSVQSQTGTKTGLINIRKRLENLYNGQALFSILPKDGLFTVVIELPVQEGAFHAEPQQNAGSRADRGR